LADLTGIKRSVDEFVEREGRLDVLWNNAGVLSPPVGAKTLQVGRCEISVEPLGLRFICFLEIERALLNNTC
jgi:retinol dehydrogenase-12